MIGKKRPPAVTGRQIDDDAIPEESIAQTDNVNSTLAQGVSAEADRRKTDWAVKAMVAALQLTYDRDLIVGHRLFSPAHRRLEEIRGALEAAIIRRRKNLRKRVGSS